MFVGHHIWGNIRVTPTDRAVTSQVQDCGLSSGPAGGGSELSREAQQRHQAQTPVLSTPSLLTLLLTQPNPFPHVSAPTR